MFDPRGEAVWFLERAFRVAHLHRHVVGASQPRPRRLTPLTGARPDSLARRIAIASSAVGKGAGLFNFLSGLLKLVAVSLVTGMLLSAMNLSAETVLAQVGLTPERLALLLSGVNWAFPNILLGTMVILPIWFVVFLLTPRQ